MLVLTVHLTRCLVIFHLSLFCRPQIVEVRPGKWLQVVSYAAGCYQTGCSRGHLEGLTALSFFAVDPWL